MCTEVVFGLLLIRKATRNGLERICLHVVLKERSIPETEVLGQRHTHKPTSTQKTPTTRNEALSSCSPTSRANFPNSTANTACYWTFSFNGCLTDCEDPFDKAACISSSELQACFSPSPTLLLLLVILVCKSSLYVIERGPSLMEGYSPRNFLIPGQG